MKQIWPLLSLVLIAAPLAANAEGLSPLSLREEASVVHAGYVPKKGQRGGDRQDNNDNNGGRDNPRNMSGQGGPQRNGGFENRSDDRINRAMQIASRRGRVLDAGPQGGSIFWVRVATDHGRVDLLVDADSGQIIGER